MTVDEQLEKLEHVEIVLAAVYSWFEAKNDRDQDYDDDRSESPLEKMIKNAMRDCRELRADILENL